MQANIMDRPGSARYVLDRYAKGLSELHAKFWLYFMQDFIVYIVFSFLIFLLLGTLYK